MKFKQTGRYILLTICVLQMVSLKEHILTFKFLYVKFYTFFLNINILYSGLYKKKWPKIVFFQKSQYMVCSKSLFLVNFVK